MTIAHKLWAFIAGAILLITGALGIAKGWDEVERFLEWVCPLPLVILLTLTNVALAALYARELRRKNRNTSVEVSADSTLTARIVK